MFPDGELITMVESEGEKPPLVMWYGRGVSSSVVGSDAGPLTLTGFAENIVVEDGIVRPLVAVEDSIVRPLVAEGRAGKASNDVDIGLKKEELTGSTAFGSFLKSG